MYTKFDIIEISWEADWNSIYLNEEKGVDISERGNNQGNVSGDIRRLAYH